MPRKTLLFTLALCISTSLLARATTREEILPAGTIIHCTLDEPNFSSKTAQVGDPVLCHLGPISALGHSVFPRGAMLSGHLQEAKDPGRFVGKGWLELEFDRIILPGAEVLPLQAKIIAAPHLTTDRDGKLHGGGHPKRDALGWMVPVLWPIKILTLPMRGPYPALKGEARLTMRLMEDVEVPVIAQGPEERSSSAIPSSYRRSAYWSLPSSSMIMVTRQVVRVEEEESSEDVNPADQSETNVSFARATPPVQTIPSESQSTLIVLRGGSASVATCYPVSQQLSCVSQDGQVSVVPLESLGLEQAVRLNRERTWAREYPVH